MPILFERKQRQNILTPWREIVMMRYSYMNILRFSWKSKTNIIDIIYEIKQNSITHMYQAKNSFPYLEVKLNMIKSILKIPYKRNVIRILICLSCCVKNQQTHFQQTSENRLAWALLSFIMLKIWLTLIKYTISII